MGVPFTSRNGALLPTASELAAYAPLLLVSVLCFRHQPTIVSGKESGLEGL